MVVKGCMHKYIVLHTIDVVIKLYRCNGYWQTDRLVSLENIKLVTNLSSYVAAANSVYGAVKFILAVFNYMYTRTERDSGFFYYYVHNMINYS